ncbi:MAG TPA: hypothetical protein VNA57_05395 [Acidimicrobiales bacterium]|nr:hypothetical protein [Acidimicrobiales bacterium]
MSAKAVRRIVLAICAGGIAGMIASSIAASTGAALTFGLVTAVAVLCAMVATAVTSGVAARGGNGGDRALVVDEAQAAKVEQLIRRIVGQGAPEDQVRDLVSEAVRLGRGGSGHPGGPAAAPSSERD